MRLIDADALKKHFDPNGIDDDYCDWNWKEIYQDVVENIDMQPTIEAEPVRHGRWIKKDNTLKCPFCGAKGEDIKDDYCFNYCPCCGANLQPTCNQLATRSNTLDALDRGMDTDESA